MIDVPVEVKDALREGSYRKNYRVVVLATDTLEEFTIDNNNLVKESVSIDERMVSGDTLKFGLCEGSSLEFQYFGKENITGRQLQVFIDVEYGANEPCTIPMGYFTVKNCSRQASTGIIKITAYNKLQSDYLDAKANDLIIEIVKNGEDGVPDEATVDTILSELLADYTIGPAFIKADYTIYSEWASVLPQISGWGFYSSADYVYSIENDNYKIGVPRIWVTIPIIDNDPNGAYRFYVNRTVIREHLIQSMGEYRYTNVRSKSTDAFVTLEDITFGRGGTEVSTPTIGFNSSKPETVKCQIADDDGEYYSDYMIKKNTAGEIYIVLPLGFYYSSTGIFNSHSHVPGGDAALAAWVNLFSNPEIFRIEKRDSNGFGSISITTAEAEGFADVTLRDLQASVFEISCQFGQLSRETDLFSGVELNHSRLLPADTLYPDNALYPDGAQESAFRSQYSKLWADEGNVRKWRYLIITYKGLDEEQNEKDFTLQRTVNADGTDDYNMSDNWLFRNLVWTAEDVGTYADAMVAKMQDITWFPFEMWAAGLPYLETGDEIEIPLGEETYTSYILQRQLKGIQNLQDTYINGSLDIF